MANKISVWKRLLFRILPEFKDGNYVFDLDGLKRSNDLAFDIGKLIITLSTFTLTLSVTLQRNLNDDNSSTSLYLGWAFEGLSILLGIIFLYSMFRIYRYWKSVSYLDFLAFTFGLLQFITFFIGLIFIAYSTTKSLS